MKIIKSSEAFKSANSDNCIYVEYSFEDKDLDLGIATITGRYPDKGFCVNTISKEVIYILEGDGQIFFENKTIDFQQGDAILINSNEKYYWESDYCKVSMTCTPTWNEKQHKLVT